MMPDPLVPILTESENKLKALNSPDPKLTAVRHCASPERIMFPEEEELVFIF